MAPKPHVPRETLDLDVSDYNVRARKHYAGMTRIVAKYLPLHKARSAPHRKLTVLLESLNHMNDITIYTAYVYRFVGVSSRKFNKVLDCIDREAPTDAVVQEVQQDRLDFATHVCGMSYCIGESINSGAYTEWRKALHVL
jgi:hypothetical protein